MADKDPIKAEKQPNIVVRAWCRLVSFVKGYFIVVGLLTSLCLGLGIWGLINGDYGMLQARQKIKPSFDKLDKLVLKLAFDRPLSDRKASPDELLWSQLFGEKPPISLQEITTGLRRAKDDDRVKSVYVDLRNFSANNASTQELRTALAAYSQTGKDLRVHLVSPKSGAYYLASVAKMISIEPADSLELTGPVMVLTYFKEALDKLGVEFQLVRAGKYKSATEPFILNEPSEATKEMYGTINDNLVQQFVDVVAPARKKSIAEVRSWLKKSLYTAGEALELGIVDIVDHRSALEDSYKKAYPEALSVSLEEYLAGSEYVDDPIIENGSEKVGLIEAFGNIVMHRPAGGSSDPSIYPERVNKELKWMADNDDVKAVVIRISSPGGSAVASDMIWNEVALLAKKKPVVVSMGSVAASGGYYIAASASKIFADPGTITGSIGVFSALPNLTAFKEKYGVSFYSMGSSNNLSIYDPGMPLSEESKGLLQRQTDSVYELFLKRVSEGRKKSRDEVHELAQGRVYTGTEALANGLVDQLGGYRQAMAEAKKLAGLSPMKLYKLATYRPDPKSALDCLGLDTPEMFECISKLQAFLPPLGSRLQEVDLLPAELVKMRSLLHQIRAEPIQALYSDGLFLDP